MIRVKRLPTNAGPAGWNEILATPKPARVLETKVAADFLIIGGGFAGISAARRLSHLDPKAKTIVVDAKRIGEGPTGRNSGFMIDLPHVLNSENYGSGLEEDKKQISLSRAAIAFALEAKKELGLSDDVIAMDGKTNAAITEEALAHNKSFQRHLTALGEASELLDAKQMHEMTGSHFYSSGLHTPDSVMVQPAEYIRALAGALPDNTQVFENSPVIEMSQTGDGWLVRTEKGQVSAGKIILATNGHAQSFGFFKRRFVHLELYASMTRAMSDEEVKLMGGAGRWGLTPSDPMGSSVRRFGGVNGNRILMRSSAAYVPRLESSEKNVKRFIPRHKDSIAKRWPQLAGLGIEYSWGGHLCLSRNNAPAFGEVERNIFSACCQNGLGTSKGTFAGMMAAELAVGNKDNLMLQTMLQAEQPEKLPPEPFATLGAKAILGYKQWKARSEL